MRRLLLLSLLLAIGWNVYAQTPCNVPVDTIDEFDSTRIVIYEPINIGYLVPSNYQTPEGPKMIEEGKLSFTFTQNDSINSFFLTLAVPEWEYHTVDKDFSVLLKLSNEKIVGLFNVPDRGKFDESTNMRIYHHTSVVPLDVFYSLTFHTLEKIRIRYRGYNRTIKISDEQAEEIQQAVQCIGARVNLYPIKP